MADPSSPGCELDERVKKLESEGGHCSWLDDKKCPAGVGLMVVNCVLSPFEHRKPAGTAAPQPQTIAKKEAIEKHHTLFGPGVPWSSSFKRMDVRTRTRGRGRRMNLQAPTAMLWKARASSSMSIGIQRFQKSTFSAATASTFAAPKNTPCSTSGQTSQRENNSSLSGPIPVCPRSVLQ
jgi:hypothetical protein